MSDFCPQISDLWSSDLDEHVEFVNPGGLFGTLKLEALHTDFYRASHRNKLLAEGFYLSGEVEKYGTGFVRIRERLKNEAPDLQLSFREDSGAFWVNLGVAERTGDDVEEKMNGQGLITSPNKGDEGVNEGVNEGANEGANEGVNRLRVLIAEWPGHRTPFYSEKLKTSVKNVERWLVQLKATDQIEFRGASKTGGYWKRFN